MGFFNDLFDSAKDACSDLRDKANDTFEDLRYKAEDACSDLREKASDTFDDLRDKANDTLDDLRDKAQEVAEDVNDKIQEKCADMNPSTLKLAEGAAKVTYGVVRGGLAASGVLGHGIAGAMVRNNRISFKARQAAAQAIGHGFEIAGEKIREGAGLLKDGLEERQNERQKRLIDH